MIVPNSAAKAEGAVLRDAALTTLRIHRADLIRRGMVEAISTAIRTGRVSADDIRPNLPVPPGTDPRFIGAIFGSLKDSGILIYDKHVQSRRRVAHARWIIEWRLADADAAAARLAALTKPAN